MVLAPERAISRVGVASANTAVIEHDNPIGSRNLIAQMGGPSRLPLTAPSALQALA